MRVYAQLLVQDGSRGYRQEPTGTLIDSKLSILGKILSPSALQLQLQAYCMLQGLYFND